jgi:DNA-binding NtrC family response regulator
MIDATARAKSTRSATFYGLVGESASMLSLYDRIAQYARAPLPVLIVGETGTGKEMAARAIHQLGLPRGKLVAVNCGALPEALAESELFGYERGAFTGASSRHEGVLAEADGGILFLDEIGDLAPAVQVKLLRALETGEYRRLGAKGVRHSRFRLICATSRDVDAMIVENRFRRDLLYRLGAARIVMPPLREHPDDIPALVEHFLAASCVPKMTRFSIGAVRQMQAYEWPGNVRQLRNVVEAAMTNVDAGPVRARAVAQFLDSTCAGGGTSRRQTLAEVTAAAEAAAVRQAVVSASGDLKEAAVILMVSVSTLYRKIARLRDAGLLSDIVA